MSPSFIRTVISALPIMRESMVIMLAMWPFSSSSSSMVGLVHVHGGNTNRSAVLFVLVHHRGIIMPPFVSDKLFTGLDRNGTGELVSAVENGRNLEQLDFLKAVSLDHRVELERRVL